VASRLHQHAQYFDHRCPMCSENLKDDDHLFQCLHSTRRQWRTHMFRKIYDTFGEILDPDLVAIIRLGLRSYFSSAIPDFSERFPTGYSTTSYADLIEQQNAIGWDHFLGGKVSTDWEMIQQQYARRYGLVKKSEGWLVRLIRLMAQSCHTLWESRNSCRHGGNSATRAQIQSDQVHREIQCLYLLGDKVLSTDRPLFMNTVEEHLTQSTAQLRAWIQHNKKLICHSVRVATAHLKLNTHRIQSFLLVQPVDRSFKRDRALVNVVPDASGQLVYPSTSRHIASLHHVPSHVLLPSPVQVLHCYWYQPVLFTSHS
jgi:hypothetical protein